MSSEQKTIEDLEEYPDCWERCKIQDLVDQDIIEKPMDGNHGGDHPTKEDYVEDGIPFIMAKNINESRIDKENCKKLPKEFADGLRKGFAKEGDVLLSHKGTVGRTAVIRETKDDYVMLSPQTTYYRVIDDDQLNNYYLKYYFDSYVFQETLKNWAGGGSTRPYLGITDQRNLPVVVPPIEVQNKIVEYLKPIGEKIRANDRINELLEELAQTLFESWFVDFEPYGEFKDSELGKIPKSFNVKNLVNIAEVTYGYSFSSDKFNEEGEGTPIIRIRNLPDDETGKYSPEDFKDKYEVAPGDVLAGMDGEFRPYIWKGPKSGLNQRVCKFEGKENIYSEIYLWNAVRKPLYKLEQSKTGTTVIHLGKGDIDQIKIPVPDKDSLRKFNELLNPIYEEMISRKKEKRKLEELRDTLLPKLMSDRPRGNDINIEDLEVNNEA